ncbi:MAG: hypothetical protein WA459_00160 [Stellaceae bacterium]
MLLAGCSSISVTSPDGKASATYSGTSIIGSEEVSCGQIAGVTTCSVSGQNVAALAQAIAPYLAGAGGIPLATSAPASAPTTVTAAPQAEIPAR